MMVKSFYALPVSASTAITTDDPAVTTAYYAVTAYAPPPCGLNRAARRASAKHGTEWSEWSEWRKRLPWADVAAETRRYEKGRR